MGLVSGDGVRGQVANSCPFGHMAKGDHSAQANQFNQHQAHDQYGFHSAWLML
jgi:hypothetical protein